MIDLNVLSRALGITPQVEPVTWDHIDRAWSDHLAMYVPWWPHILQPTYTGEIPPELRNRYEVLLAEEERAREQEDSDSSTEQTEGSADEAVAAGDSDAADDATGDPAANGDPAADVPRAEPPRDPVSKVRRKSTIRKKTRKKTKRR